MFCATPKGPEQSSVSELKYQGGKSQMDCDYCPGTDWTAYESRMWAEFHYSPQVRCISWKENEISKENHTYGQTVAGFCTKWQNK